MINLINKIFKDNNTKTLDGMGVIVKEINSFEKEMSSLSDEKLSEKTLYFKNKIKNDESLDNILPEAFAVVREVSKRTLKQRHFDVQLMGGVVLHNGNIVEMKTGEGKTLAATLPAYLNALTEKGIHIVTVNDYLARRDAVWMGQIYSFLGLSVGVINGDASYLYDPKYEKQEDDKERDEFGYFKIVHDFLRPCTRREAYEADITYGTNNEFGFDYLRDNIAYKKSETRQREFNYAIVDEIDSILIDEARTPLIISAATTESEDLYRKFADIANKMKKDEDYEVDEKLKATTLTDAGIERAEKLLGVENIYTEMGIKYVHHLETAIRAKALFSKDKDYVVRDGQILIVDSFTGRILPGRRYSEGIHQAIEAKENVFVQKESRTFASITFQNYFRLYKKLSGMTGTAITSAEEFRKVYGLDTIVIPTNREMKREDRGDFIFQTEQGKFKAISKKIKELNDRGQPVLIGTVSIEKNELLSEYLSMQGVKHNILNAKNHEREGEIIAEAGKKGFVTIATNMAGRGVDIKLGGQSATEEEYNEVKKLGGLFVLGTERHEARRIDNQLRGRSGRQGDPGETQFFVSLEDDLMRVFASDSIKKMMNRFGIPEDQPIENKMISKALESAQTKIEGFHFDSRRHILEFDDVLNHQRRTIYERRRKILFSDNIFLREFLEERADDIIKFKKILDERLSQLDEETFFENVRQIILQTMDMFWVEHLEMMDYMRSSVNLRAYGQRDPLVEYKKEGLNMFKQMELGINEQIFQLIPRIGEGIKLNEGEKQLNEVHESAKIIGDTNKGNIVQENKNRGAGGQKIGRNDPCPCGNGKKYKKCHGK
ncbi:preprotein translocase subunit SecA [Patescibacteria group bacterium]|nr:preprotein translocase subunit SecA [Patescibacteria group bacterium]MBU4115930.1 preprotein translocase subunit SecA [Patescibacteria group bacterium]